MSSEDGNIWLVVGLGNPGARYENTYHNMGRRTASEFAMRRTGSCGRWRAKFRGELCSLEVGGSRVLVLLPDTYMNLAGDSVGEAARVLRLPAERVIVAHDDLDLEPGRLRVRLNGGDGGHKGVFSCFQALGTADFVRLRIGIGRDLLMDPADYVLSKIRPEHLDALQEAILRGDSAIEIIITKGLQKAMNEFNRKQEEDDASEEGDLP